MSHFTVGVVIPGTYKEYELYDAVEKALAPFDEKIEMEPYIEEYKFDIIGRLKREKEEIVSLAELLLSDENEFDRVYPRYNKGWIKDRYETIKDMTDMQLYEEETKYHKSDGNIDDDGNILSTYNPESKWDYWLIGGRWSNLVATRDPEGNIVGSDYSRFKNIIFIDTYYKKEGLDSKEDLLSKYMLDPDFREDIDDHYQNIDEFIKEIETPKSLTYAMLIDGSWIEPGKMGWFAVSDATDTSREQYEKTIVEYLDSKKDSEDWLIIVDCHI